MMDRRRIFEVETLKPKSVRSTLFRFSNLTEPYHSVNLDIHKRIEYLDA